MMKYDKNTLSDQTSQIRDSDDFSPGQAGTGTGRDGDASAVDVIYKWSQGTSVHGIPYFMDRENFAVWWRLAWAVFVCGSTVMMLTQVSSLIADFFSYTVTTSVETVEPFGLVFPDVTVCSSNRYDFRYFRVGETPGPVNDEEIKTFTPHFEDLFILPTYENKDATQNWTSVITPYGECWQFHTDEMMENPTLANDRGLDFLIFFDQFQIFQPSTIVAGLYVFLHEPGALITEQDTFHAFAPGGFYFAEIEKREYFRETQKPWSTCKGNTPVYTQQRCRAECYYTRVREECGCRKIGDPSDEGMDYCDPDDPVHLNDDCARFLTREELDACDCAAPPCTEVVYEIKTVSKLNAADDFLTSGVNTTRVDWDKDWMKLTLNYGSVRKEVVTETKAQTYSQLLGSIGGTMGLYLGISLISVIEIFGELGLFRLLPRLCGVRGLYGLGGYGAGSARIVEGGMLENAAAPFSV